MKKILGLVLSVILLSGCSLGASSDNVIELLSSPKLSENETEIVSAITLYSDAEVVLKYLKEADNISPIQYIDVDGNGVDEAIVFYTSPSTSGYVKMAVLYDNDGVWEVVDDLSGLGTEVLNVSLVQLDKSKGNQLVVTYSFANTLEKVITVYSYSDGNLVETYNQLCQSYIMSDITSDGNIDIIIGQPNVENILPSIKLISLNEENQIAVVADYELNVANAEIQSLKLSKTSKSETPAVVVDYKDNQNVIHTQAITYSDNEFISVLESSVIQKIWSFNYPLISFDIGNDNYLETSTIIQASESENLDYMEWTSYLTDPIERKLFGVVDGRNQIFVSMPEEWQGYIFLNEISSVEWNVIAVNNSEENQGEESPDSQENIDSQSEDITQGEDINQSQSEETIQDETDETLNIEFEEIDSDNELVRIRIINPGTAFYKNDGEEIFEVGLLRVAISFSDEVSLEQREIIYNNIIYLG